MLQQLSIRSRNVKCDLSFYGTIIPPTYQSINHLPITYQPNIYLPIIDQSIYPLFCLSINYLSFIYLSVSSSSLRIQWKAWQEDRLGIKTSNKLTICSFIQQTFIELLLQASAVLGTEIYRQEKHVYDSEETCLWFPNLPIHPNSLRDR